MTCCAMTVPCCDSASGLHTGQPGALGVSNIRHAINIDDVVSDTVHQFAPTYHSYVLYSNSGARNAPKTVRSKEVFVLPDEPNKFHDNANLLANMELGIHSSGQLRSTMSDQEEGASARKQQGTDDALYRANTFSDVEDDFRQGPLEEDEVGFQGCSWLSRKIILSLMFGAVCQVVSHQDVV